MFATADAAAALTVVVSRARLEGVVPRDPESVKLLADEAEDLALSWGKPAGLMAYTCVDSIIFVFFSRC